MILQLRLLSPRRLTSYLLTVIAFLILASIVGQAAKHGLGHPQTLGLVSLTYVDLEGNLPAWYSSLALLLASALLATIALAKGTGRDPYRWHWSALSAIFLLLSTDEAVSLHELPIEPLREALHAQGALYYTWVIPGAAFALAVGLCYVKFLRSLPTSTRRRFVLAACVFLAGALGVEMLSGWHADRFGEENFTYSMIVTIEELFEMLGVVIFLHALLEYLHGSAVQIRLHLNGGVRGTMESNSLPNEAAESKLAASEGQELVASR